jgi:hypothetical protein
MGQWKLNVNASCVLHLSNGSPNTSDWLAPPDSGLQSFYADYDELFSKEVRLYNLGSDTMERYDVSDEFPEIVEHMLALLDEYKAGEVMSQTVALEPDESANPSNYGGQYVPWLDDYEHPLPLVDKPSSLRMH